ncbi:ABC transporter substrate-binding protein [Falsigemmobacter faecalis]|uniref:ABC transporter substrate-binding protein n=1 Tax=Falsigemmobacter faecalis TaxID=2488730 RepID=A0A3P3D646_9RHOB|nr:ABC transporter substrate-binding protein [Falsigemmobacter faecalis]RRH69284.1 ABC transporter substrate-binding protein [Falsigemmobacter faecalis]
MTILKKPAIGRAFWAVIAMAMPVAGLAQIPEGYPAEYADILAVAEAEGSVVIYANTEHAAVEAILADFQKAFPKIRADYIEIKAADLFSRVSSEAAADALKADVVWSSAMDLQYQMVEDGVAAEYASPEKGAIPEWASYGDRIYGTTYEPVVMVYNSKVVADDQMPRTHAGLASWLTENRDTMKGKVATYDPERSGLGFFAVNEDAKHSDDLWPLVTAFGAVDTKFYTATGTMLEKISAGEHAIGYNIVGPYAYLRAERDPNVKVVVPQDFTVVLSRLAIVTEQARHPNAARVFLDYLLSHRGQSVIGNAAHLFAIRPDVEGKATIAGLTAEHGDRLKPVAIGPHLLDAIQPMERLAFFRKWADALKAGK